MLVRGSYKYRALQNLKVFFGFIIGSIFIVLVLMSFIKDKSIPFDPGTQIPEITGTTPSNANLSVKDLSSRYILIHYWASWSNSSLQQIQDYRRLHKTYSRDHLDIYSISMDYHKQDWISGIRDNQMQWSNHVSDLQGWQSPLADKLNVKIIPSSFLVDPNGKIIGRNLSISSLERELSE